MAGKQLRDMLTDLRAEVGHSTNVAHGVNDRETLIYYLNRTQIQLYQDYDWPQLIVQRTVVPAEGQRFYPYPADLAFDDVTKVWVQLVGPTHTSFTPLLYGITIAEWSVPWNSLTGYKAWPPRKWLHHADDNTMELWPVPDVNATQNVAQLFVHGTRTVEKMVNDSDLSTLPDNLIVLFAAVEILQRDDAKDAALKLNKANEAMRRHRVRQFSHKNTVPIVIGGGGGDAQSRGRRWPAIGLDYVPPGYGSGP